MLHSTRRRIRAFTLVELLVVIGIIAVLIGVLLPVLAGVSSRGRDIKCQANLRSIMQALYGYAAENKGSYPYGFYWNKSLTSGNWGEAPDKIGRASCRERVEMSVVAVSSRRRHTRFDCDWSSDVCSSDLRRPTAGACRRVVARARYQVPGQPALDHAGAVRIRCREQGLLPVRVLLEQEPDERQLGRGARQDRKSVV